MNRVPARSARPRSRTTCHRLLTSTGITSRPIACVSPSVAVSTGSATSGSPIPVAPFTTPPAASVAKTGK